MTTCPRWVYLATLLLLACRDGGSGGAAGPSDPGGGDPPGDPPAAPPAAPEPGCTPRTCELLGARCGTHDDYCGGVVACGECPEGETCGLSGVGALCAAPLPARAPAWLWHGPSDGRDDLGGLAADAEGNALVVSYSGAESAVALDRVRAPGAATPVRRFPVTGTLPGNVFRPSQDLRRGPDGTLYLGVTGFVGFGDVVYVDLGAGPRTGAQTVALSPGGAYLRTVLACCDTFFESTEWIEDVDRDGNVLVGFWSTGASGTRLLRADGRELLLYSHHNVTLEEHGERCASPRFLPGGGFACAGVEEVTRRDLDDRILWRTPLARDGFAVLPAYLGVTARGTIVVAGSLSASAGRGVYAALEPGGAVRFQRDLPAWPRGLAVLPSGRAALLLSDGGDEAARAVLYADLAGELLWQARVPRAGRIAFAGERVVVAGTLPRGAHDLGTGPFELASSDVYVVAFDP